MEIPALPRLKHKDIGALAVFGLVGWMTGNVISDPTWAFYTAFLVCDHLFLGWFVFLSDNRTRRPFPIEVILLIHTVFVILVVVIVAARDSFHFFALFPLPMAAFALWLLSCAIGYEKALPEPVAAGSDGAKEREPKARRIRKPAWTGRATRGNRPGTASRPSRSEPLSAAPETPEPAIAGPAIAEAAIAAAQPGSDPKPAEPAPNYPQSGVAETAPRSSTAIHEVLTVTESPDDPNYRPTVPGIGLDWPPKANPLRHAPVQLWRDNSIAAELRRTYSEEAARFYPSLVATAEDNEAWIDARGKENPTHRKVGSTVREEYEDWLSARLLARAPEDGAADPGYAAPPSSPPQAQA